ncbi:hypothetical protein Ocin01_11415 [Orchesella cincta]|uniref:Uncharacterized protein n=1 Tax=Orchesella cincta TaxID=48709 RepID=A0A1D2MRB5_ORCCI|nr:hypothetical protein Ocin01_11415 [Orchesella cincta]
MLMRIVDRVSKLTRKNHHQHFNAHNRVDTKHHSSFTCSDVGPLFPSTGLETEDRQQQSWARRLGTLELCREKQVYR